MEKDTKTKLIEYIENSKLNNDEKELWHLFVRLSYDHEDEAVYEAVTEDTDSLNLLTAYLREKILHMKKTNSKAWRALIAKESKYAELLS